MPSIDAEATFQVPYLHASVLLLQPCPDAAPRVGVDTAKDSLRDAVPEIVGPPGQDLIEPREQVSEIPVQG